MSNKLIGWIFTLSCIARIAYIISIAYCACYFNDPFVLIWMFLAPYIGVGINIKSSKGDEAG